MEKNHKHDGVLLSNGSLRSHPITRMHGDKEVKKAHNLSLTAKEKVNYLQSFKHEASDFGIREKTETKKEVKTGQTVNCPLDSEGYVSLDLRKSSGIRGIRLIFERVEGRLKRKVALQIEK